METCGPKTRPVDLDEMYRVVVKCSRFLFSQCPRHIPQEEFVQDFFAWMTLRNYWERYDAERASPETFIWAFARNYGRECRREKAMQLKHYAKLASMREHQDASRQRNPDPLIRVMVTDQLEWVRRRLNPEQLEVVDSLLVSANASQAASRLGVSLYTFQGRVKRVYSRLRELGLTQVRAKTSVR